MNRFATLLFASSLLIACGDATDDGKGAEENELTDGKSDSFFRPTEHGALRMGVENPGQVTDDAQFHAWTFELTDSADVELHTDVSQNLDTVLYVYRRDSPDESWGRYIKKNDDDGSKISSRIKLPGAKAGEYRVIVKPFKTALRGGFTLNGACDGAGCTTGTDSCAPDVFADLPLSTQWSTECAFDTAGVFNSETVSQSSTEVSESTKCALVGIELLAVDFYREWWDGIVGFEDQFRYDPDEEIFFEVDTTRYHSGATVFVNAGGDEDGLEFVFDEDDRLLAAYQHNQSPTVDFYCLQAGEAPIDGPDEGCFGDVMQAMPHNDETPRVSASVSIADAATVHEAVGVAAARHGEQFGLDATAVVSYDLITWESDNGEDVVDVNIENELDGSVQYWLINDYRCSNGSCGSEWAVILEADANGVSYVCE